MGSTLILDLLENDQALGDAVLVPNSVEVFGTAPSGTVSEVSSGILVFDVGPTASPGVVTFGYKVEDDQGRLSNLTTVTLFVEEAGDQPPLAVDDFVSVEPDLTGTSVVSLDLLANDTAFGGAVLDPDSVDLTNLPTDLVVTYQGQGVALIEVQAGTPPAITGFDYVVSDSAGLVSDPGHVTVEIEGGSFPPEAVDDEAEIEGGTPLLAMDILANDIVFGGLEPDTETVTLVDFPSLGVAQVVGGELVYLPEDGQPAGVVTMTYRFADTAGNLSNVAQVSITVLPNQGDGDGNPQANDDQGFVSAGDTLELDLLANDSPGDSQAPLDPASIEIVIGDTQGQVSLDDTGVLTYVAAPDSQTAQEVFLYRVSDTEGTYSNFALVVVYVLGGGGGNGQDGPQLTAPNLDTNQFQPSTLTISLEAEGGLLADQADGAFLFLNGTRVQPISIAQSSSGVLFAMELVDGRNLIHFITRDSTGRAVEWQERVYSGSREVLVRLRDAASGGPASGVATFLTVGYYPLEVVYPIAPSGTLIPNVPDFAMGIRGRNATRLGAGYINALDTEVEVEIANIATPAPFNGDFSDEIGEAAPDDWDTSGSELHFVTDDGFLVQTYALAQQRARHTFTVPAAAAGDSVRQVAVRYSISSQELVDGAVAEEYDDYFVVSIRSSQNTIEVRSDTLRSLGLSTFNGGLTSAPLEISLPIDVSASDVDVEVEVRLANVGIPTADSWITIEEVRLDSVSLAMDGPTNHEGDPMRLLSVGSHEGYAGTPDQGAVFIGGRLELGFDPAQPITQAWLEVRGEGAGLGLAFPGETLAGLIAAAPGSNGMLDTGEDPELFRLSPAAAVALESAQTLLRFRLFVQQGAQLWTRDLNHQAFALHCLPTGSDLRIGDRSPELGGDGWLLPQIAEVVQQIPFLYIDDCSRMNGGRFPGVQAHEWGIELDMWRPSYQPSSAAGAQAVLSLFAVPEIGEFIGSVQADFEPTPTDAFYQELVGEVLPDGRSALDVILPFVRDDSTFHVRVRPEVLTDSL